MNVDDIRNVVFDKSMRGYRMEEVDAFLAQVAAEFEKLTAEKEDLEKKLYILAEKVDQYRSDEDTLKTALLNAQRMGESVIYEARQKAETIVYDANTKASQIRDEAAQHVNDMEMQLNRLKAEVANFKSSVLTLYRQHIELLSAIPVEERSARHEAQAPAAPKASRENANSSHSQEPHAEKSAKPIAGSEKEAAVKKASAHPVEEEELEQDMPFDIDQEEEEPYESGFDDDVDEYDDLEMPDEPYDEEDEELRPSRPSDLDSYEDISFD